LIYQYDENDEIVTTTSYWYLLPETLKIDGNIEPEKLRRGIYEVVVYKSNISVKGNS
jgi:inner membrane protein